jgi:hypothetical protein
MPKERNKRADGTEIDPVKDLAEFVQAIPPTDETTITTAPEDWRKVVLADVDDEDLKGKTAEDAARIAKERKAEAERFRAEAEESRRQLAATQQRVEMEAVARRVAAEQAPPPARQAAPEPQEDPREAQLQDLWMTGDYAGWKRLNDTMQREERQKEIAAAEDRATQKALNTIQATDASSRQNQAYTTAASHLTSLGVNPTKEQWMAVYVNLTHQASKYRAYGGPEDARNVVAQYRELFGLPDPKPAEQPTAAAAAPAVVVPPAPVVATPPGSARPAAAAAPRREAKETHLTPQRSREIEQLANAFRMDPEKLKARHRKTLSEGDAHA